MRDPAKFVPHLHQGKPQQIGSLPFKRITCIRITGVKTDSPDAVIGAGLRQNAVAGGEQEIPQFPVLAEFAPVSIENYGIPGGRRRQAV